MHLNIIIEFKMGFQKLVEKKTANFFLKYINITEL